jgi:HAMP domain-containing protein
VTRPGTFWSRIRPTAVDARSGLRLLSDLPRFLGNPVTRAEAAARIAERLAARDRDFLRIARIGAFENPRSPYGPLFRHAGLAFGDLVSLVTADGVESALDRLRRAGVYLDNEELKGRTPVRRGRVEFLVSPDLLRNPLGRGGLPSASSGTRGPRTAAPIDLRHLRERSINLRATLSAREGEAWIHAEWHTLGGWGIKHVLELAGAGFAVDRWFSQVDERGRGLPAAYRWSVGSVRAVSRLCGRALPGCELALPESPTAVRRWIDDVRAAGRTPHLTTYPSTGVALSAASRRAGSSLEGLELTLLGEPLTPARRRNLEGAGARIFPRYGSAETGPIGAGCLQPATSDDMHLYRDLVGAVVDDEERLYVTGLRETAPLLLINAGIGDRVRIEPRGCGCPLDAQGWHDHIHSIRSDALLSAEGTKISMESLVRTLEESLPRRFGGDAGDFQVLEVEGADGRSIFRLRAHPRLGELSPETLVAEFLTALESSTSLPGATLQTWRAAGAIVVERRPPEAGASGKILLHRRRAAEA